MKISGLTGVQTKDPTTTVKRSLTTNLTQSSPCSGSWVECGALESMPTLYPLLHTGSTQEMTEKLFTGM